MSQSSSRSYNIADLAYPDIQAYLKTKDIVLVPMASTEQHGPHLPLKTDTVTAEEVSRRVAARRRVALSVAAQVGRDRRQLGRQPSRKGLPDGSADAETVQQ